MKRRSVLMLAIVGLLVLAQGLTADAQEKKKKGQGIRGKVKAVDASAKTITVTTRVKKQSQDKTYTLAENCKITIEGKSGTLADIKPGTQVRLRLGEGEKVTAIRVGGRKKKKD